MSDKDYNKRDDTFRNFKKKMQAQNPNFMNAGGESAYADFMKEEAEKEKAGAAKELEAAKAAGQAEKEALEKEAPEKSKMMKMVEKVEEQFKKDQAIANQHGVCARSALVGCACGARLPS